jgi:hypothetical protein
VYHDGHTDEPVYLKLYFDKMPVSIPENDAFKAHIAYLQNLWQFRKARIIIRHDDIAEIDSHKHSIQQCMDIVLGSISFMLNKKNEEIPAGATERGHRTIAKEQLFFHILEHIKDCNNIELKTATISNCLTSATQRQLLFQKTSGASLTGIGSSPRRSSGTTIKNKKAPLELHKPPWWNQGLRSRVGLFVMQR